MADLAPCPLCRRHIRASERSCPFCRSALRSPAPLVVALSALLPLACGKAEPAHPDTTSATGAASSAGAARKADGDQRNANPGPTQTATAQPTQTATAQPTQSTSPRPIDTGRVAVPAYGIAPRPTGTEQRKAPAYGGPPPLKP